MAHLIRVGENLNVMSRTLGPAMKARASPRLTGRRTMWSTPWARATSEVPSLEPSSMTSNSTASNPGISRGSASSVMPRVRSSL